MNEKKHLLKNTGLIAIGNLGAKITSFLLLPLYTSILSTAEYGDYDYIVTIGSFLLPLVTLNMHEAMFRFLIDSDNEEQFNSVISHALLVVLAGVMAIIGLGLVLNYTSGLEYILYIVIYVCASVMYTFFNSILRGMGLVKKYAVWSCFKNCLQIVLNVISIAVLGRGLQGLLLALIISEIAASLIVAFQIKIWRLTKFREIKLFKIKEMLRYALPLVPNSLSATIINISDRIMIKSCLGSSLNGIYSISYKFPNIIETVYHYFYTAWSESASRILKSEQAKVEAVYNDLYKQVDNLVYGVIIVLTAAMPILFRIFIRGDYVQGFAYVPMLMFAMYFNCIGNYYTGIFTAYKKTNVLAISTIIGAIVNILINVFFIKKYGLYATAASTLVANFVLVAIRYFAIKPYVKIHLELKGIIGALSVTSIVSLLYTYNTLWKIGLSLTIAVIYAVIINRRIIRGTINFGMRKMKSRIK